MLIVDIAVITRELEAVLCVHESSFTDTVYARRVSADPDIYGGVEQVLAFLYLALYFLAFPLVPIGNMVELGFSIKRL